MSNCPSTKGQEGFALVGTVIVLPALLLILFLFLSRWQELRATHQMRHICREQLADGQKKAAQSLRSLLFLNPAVRAVKMEKQAAEAALFVALAANNPPAIAAARLWLSLVQKKQTALKARQQTLLYRMRFDRHLTLTKAEFSLRRFSSKALLEHTSFSFRAPATEESVRPVPPLDPYPEYELKPQFENLQKMELRWQSKFQNKGEEQKWMQRKTQWTESCGMTLGKTDLLVKPAQDKFFWRR